MPHRLWKDFGFDSERSEQGCDFTDSHVRESTVQRTEAADEDGDKDSAGRERQ